jgi:DNA-binding NarL/FixJ family response regulator
MRVLIVDDHPLFIKGVEALLMELDASVIAIGARTIEEATEVAGRLPVDLVLLDLKLPGTQDLDSLIRMRQALEATPIVVVSANDNADYIWKAIELGAAGYIPKDTEQALMIHALRVVIAHGVYLPPHALRGDGHAASAPHATADSRADELHLTDREFSVLRGLLQGKSNKVIGRELGIAEGTVKAHLSHCYEALGVAEAQPGYNKRLEAMKRAYELRLIDRFGANDQQQGAAR